MPSDNQRSANRRNSLFGSVVHFVNWSTLPRSITWSGWIRWYPPEPLTNIVGWLSELNLRGFMVYYGVFWPVIWHLWHFLPRIWLFMTSSRVLWFLWVLSTLVLWAFMGCLVKKDHKIKSENKIKKGMGIQLKCDYCSGPISGKTHVFKFANFERFFCCTECRAAYKKKYSGKIEALTKRHHNINYSW